jgi:hypothetical protein
MGEVMQRGEMRVLSTVAIPGGNRKVVCGKYGDYFQVDQVQGVITNVEIINDINANGAVLGGLAVAGGGCVLPRSAHALGR